MRFVWTLCVKDLRQRLRDRAAVMVAVVVPLLLSGIVGLALGSNEAGFEMRWDGSTSMAHAPRPRSATRWHVPGSRA